MTIESLTLFFMWCTIINGALLLYWTAFLIFAPDLIYRIQTKFFPLSKETFTTVMYCFLGLFKLVFITLNLVPYLALLIIG